MVAIFDLFSRLNTALENFIVWIKSQGSVDASIAAYKKKKDIRNQVEAENLCTIIKNLIWYKVLQYETSFFYKAR